MEEFSTYSDEKLWRLFKEGDKAAFAALFNRFYSQLFLYGIKISTYTDEVEDAIQELFTDLWNGRARDISLTSVKAYLFTAFRFKIYRLLKNRSKRSKEITSNTVFELGADDFLCTAENNLEHQERLIVAMNKISPRQREIIYLKFYRNLDYEQTAEILEISYQACRNLLYTSIKSLRAAYPIAL